MTTPEDGASKGAFAIRRLQQGRSVTFHVRFVPALALLVVMGLTGCNSGTASRADAHGRLKTSSPITSVPGPTTTLAIPSGGSSNAGSLNSVSCVPSGQCVTVGSTSGPPVTLTRLVPGAQWSVGAPGLPTAINSVSCVAPSTCLAIGTPGATTTGFQEWSGQSWTSLPPPPSGPVNGLDTTAPADLSCTSVSSCVAVGGATMDITSTGGETAVIQRWTGQDWAVPTTPLMPATRPGNVLLSDVSCVSPTFCMAVGYQQVGAHDLALAEGWNGTQWRTLPMPAVSGSVDLQAVSCTSTSFCRAVGTVDPPNTGRSVTPTRTIAEAWNGSSWSKVPNPHPFGKDLWMSTPALTCTSSSHCLAVWSSLWPIERFGGPTPPNAGFPAVSQLWNGSSWSFVPMPNPSSASGQYNILYDASCTDAIDCVAVGTTVDGTQGTMLIESWDGSQWTEDQPSGS